MRLRQSEASTMRTLRRHAGIGWSVAFMLLHQPAHAIDIMEAIGAERCGRGVRSYQIDFLAPENATLEAKAKVVAAKGPADSRAVTLSLNGKECTNGRCGFEARKGESYRLSAAARLSGADELCIV